MKKESRKRIWEVVDTLFDMFDDDDSNKVKNSIITLVQVLCDEPIE